MSGYKKFSECGTFNGCGKFSVRGDQRVMTPLFSGKIFTDPYRIVNNDIRVFPPVQTRELEYERFSKAYPQAKL